MQTCSQTVKKPWYCQGTQPSALNPAQDLAAREMGLRLVEKCQQINVYGPVTEGMWAEIHRANKLDIPVVTALKTKGRTSPRRKKSAKREEVK